MIRSDKELIEKEFHVGLLLILHSCEVTIARSKLREDGKDDTNISLISSEVKSDLSKRLSHTIELYKKSWLNRNRVGGLSDSCQRLLNNLNLLN